MPFERFTRSAARTDADARWVSVQGNGSISVSFAAMNAIGLPDHVYLLHDAETKQIALQAAPQDNPDAYRARLQGRKDSKIGARVISASAFFKHIGVDSAKASGRYEAEIVEDMVAATLPGSAYHSAE